VKHEMILEYCRPFIARVDLIENAEVLRATENDLLNCGDVSRQGDEILQDLEVND
jgi:hypothetical protein